MDSKMMVCQNCGGNIFLERMRVFCNKMTIEEVEEKMEPYRGAPEKMKEELRKRYMSPMVGLDVTDIECVSCGAIIKIEDIVSSQKGGTDVAPPTAENEITGVASESQPDLKVVE